MRLGACLKCLMMQAAPFIYHGSVLTDHAEYRTESVVIQHLHFGAYPVAK
jgi:hypothetical protein